MFFSKTRLILAILVLPLAQAQLSLLPQCVQDCISSSQDDNCSATNITCLCRASAGKFLPDLISCLHDDCYNELDNSALLTPLQWACSLAGAPIPSDALQSAENEASSLVVQSTAAPATVTITMWASSTEPSGSLTSVTVTTTEDGSTFAVVYPVTQWSTRTVSGVPSTITAVSTSGGFGGLIPVIITSTDSAGSTYITTTSLPGAISTYTMTDSRGSTTTQKTTFTTAQSSSSSGEAASNSVTSSTTVMTSTAAEKTTSSGQQSEASSTPDSDETNSSPFKDTNAAVKTPVGNLLGLSLFLALACFWL